MANLITVPRNLSVSPVDLHHYPRGSDCKHPILLILSKLTFSMMPKGGKIKMTMHVLIVPWENLTSRKLLFTHA